MESSIFILKNGRFPGKTSEEEEESKVNHLRSAQVCQYFFNFFNFKVSNVKGFVLHINDLLNIIFSFIHWNVIYLLSILFLHCFNRSFVDQEHDVSVVLPSNWSHILLGCFQQHFQVKRKQLIASIAMKHLIWTGN